MMQYSSPTLTGKDGRQDIGIDRVNSLDKASRAGNTAEKLADTAATVAAAASTSATIVVACTAATISL